MTRTEGETGDGGAGYWWQAAPVCLPLLFVALHFLSSAPLDGDGEDSDGAGQADHSFVYSVRADWRCTRPGCVLIEVTRQVENDRALPYQLKMQIVYFPAKYKKQIRILAEAEAF